MTEVLSSDDPDPNAVQAETSPRRRDPLWRRPSTLALVAVLAILAIAFRGLRGLSVTPPNDLEVVEAFFFEPSATAPTFVFFVSLWMFYRRWRPLKAAFGFDVRPLSGGLLLVTGLLIGTWATYVSFPALLLWALILTLLGSALCTGGMRALKTVLTPVLFLLFAMPLPALLINYLIYPLQTHSAETTHAILNFFAGGAGLAGDRIYFGQKIFQVIETCSGLRGTLTLVMSAVLYLELFRQSRTRAAILLLSAPLIGYAINQGRILSIIFNPYSEIATVHNAQGVVALVVGVFAIAFVDYLLGFFLKNDNARRRTRNIEESRNLRPTVAVAIGLCLFTVGTFLIKPWRHEPAALAPLSSVPAQIETWQAGVLRLDKQFLGSTRFDNWVHRRYRQNDADVDLLMLSDRRLDPQKSLLSPKLSVPGSGWTRESRIDEEKSVFRSPVGRQLVHLEIFGASPPGVELLRGALSLDRGPWRRPGRIVVVRLATPIDRAPAGLERAVRRVDDFRSALGDDLERIVATR